MFHLDFSEIPHVLFVEFLFLAFVSHSAGGIGWYLFFFFYRDDKFFRECKYIVDWPQLQTRICGHEYINIQIKNLLTEQNFKENIMTEPYLERIFSFLDYEKNEFFFTEKILVVRDMFYFFEQYFFYFI